MARLHDDRAKETLGISVVIVNKNSSIKLSKCLKTIRSQNYPQQKIEILVIDGGSVDDSVKVSRKYKAKFVNGGYPQNMEARRFVGYKLAKKEIIAVIDTDNYLPSKDWLLQMVRPLAVDNTLFASQPLYYTYRKSDSVFNRYFSLFGVNDPVAYYLKKADRQTYFDKGWVLRGNAVDKRSYYKVSLEAKIPTVGSNGFLIRNKILQKVLTNPESLFHIDIIQDLVNRGYKNIAFVKVGVIHETGDTLLSLIRKRTSYFRQHSVKLSKLRRYKVFDPQDQEDRVRLFLFVVYSITLIRPVFDSIRGFVKKPDLAWFLHPVVCISFLVSYGFSTIRVIIGKTLIH